MKPSVRRSVLAVCIAVFAFAAAWLWWCNSDLRTFLVAAESRGKLLGISMGLHAYYDANQQLPDPSSWKEVVLQMAVHEPGKPIFASPNALQNCFILTFKDCPWTSDFKGEYGDFRKRFGDAPIAICHPAGSFRESCSATASLEDSGDVMIYDCTGTNIGNLPPETTIFTLYSSGTILSQTVGELARHRNLDTVTDR